MLVKIHSRGQGGGSGPVDYLLGKDRERELAFVLRGNPEQTKELIDSLSFKRNYTSGVLSFEEADLPDHKKQELMNELERHLMSGLGANQYECLWIEHRDKGRLELNFLIPNVELVTGKRLQPYFDRVDRSRNDAFQTYMNGKYQLSDPNDPSKNRIMSYAADLPDDKHKMAEHITNGLMHMVTAGEISNRNDIIKSLNNNGFPVVRETKKAISIRVPGEARNTRLTGAIYEQSFTASPTLRAEIEKNGKLYGDQLGQRTEKARILYESEILKKSEYNRERYEPKFCETDRAVDSALDRTQQCVERHQSKLRESHRTVNNALDRTQPRVEKDANQNPTDVQSRPDTRDIGNVRITSTGLEISNNHLKFRLNEYERDTKTTSAHNQAVRAAATATKQTIRGTSDSISATVKQLAETIGDYATAVIRLGELRREKRIERQPSPRFRR